MIEMGRWKQDLSGEAVCFISYVLPAVLIRDPYLSIEEPGGVLKILQKEIWG